jgi:hypothetical protein
VNHFRRMRSEAAERSAERRRREDEAPRLTNLVPKLDSLKLEIEEHHAGVRLAESVHVKRVSVPHAPALFDLPCLDSFCKDGGHDMTDAILRSLQAGKTEFEGEDACRGHTGTAECRRVLRFTAHATYKP